MDKNTETCSTEDIRTGLERVNDDRTFIFKWTNLQRAVSGQVCIMNALGNEK